MARVNQKNEAAVSALGPGTRKFDDGEVRVVLVWPDGSTMNAQILAEHDGTLVLAQIGGRMTVEDYLDKSSRGTTAGRANLAGTKQ